jgi:hypothetical protein
MPSNTFESKWKIFVNPNFSIVADELHVEQ